MKSEATYKMQTLHVVGGFRMLDVGRAGCICSRRMVPCRPRLRSSSIVNRVSPAQPIIACFAMLRRTVA